MTAVPQSRGSLLMQIARKLASADEKRPRAQPQPIRAETNRARPLPAEESERPATKSAKQLTTDTPGSVLQRLARELAARDRAEAAARQARERKPPAAAAAAPASAADFYGPAEPAPRARFSMPRNASAEEKRSLLLQDIHTAISAATPANTTRTYQPYQKQYAQFCADKGLGAPTGTSEEMAPKIAAFILSRGSGANALAISTLHGPVRAALGALVPYHDDRPTTRQIVRKALFAITHTAPNPKHAKEPITPELLTRIVKACWDAKSRTATRDGAMFVLMTFGVLRRSEAVALRKEHVTRKATRGTDGKEISCVQIVVERAKNDQKREGSKRILPAASDPKSPLCPVGAYLRLMTIVGEHPPHSPLFVNLTDDRTKRSGYHVRTAPKPLSGATPNRRLKHWLHAVGADTDLINRIGSHSLRKAAATIAFAAQIPRLTIQRAGAWRSDAVDAYITVNEAEHAECWREVVDNANAESGSDIDD